MEINWEVTDEDEEIIHRLAQRAYALCDGAIDLQTLEMDLTACHMNGCPLRLEELESGPAFSFMHDIYGINRHINHETGEIEGFFIPRYADHS